MFDKLIKYHNHATKICHQHYTHRLIEIDGTFAPRTGRRGRAKRIKRNTFSFIIRVREMELFRGQPIRAFVQFYYFLNDKIIICHDSVVIKNITTF